MPGLKHLKPLEAPEMPGLYHMVSDNLGFNPDKETADGEPRRHYEGVRKREIGLCD